ncbi:MAG: EamA family transporter [Acidimicrobiales bacterium]
MWIVITLAATVFQILRTSEQHRLRSVLSVTEAGSVRYLYALPFALAGLGITSLTWDAAPTVHSRFVPIVIAAGVCQILGTICLLQSFRVRDFAVGTVYSKGEVILVAIASAVLIHEVPSPLGWVGVVVVFIGIVWLASQRVADPGEAFTRLDPAALLGLAAGGLFALTSIGIRSASRAIDGGSDFEHALITLAGMLSSQVVINGLGLAVAPNESLVRVLKAWRAALPVGVLSLGGSASWAWAIAIEGPTKVRTLGQVELVLAFAIGIVVHHERHHLREYLASAMILAGIVGIVVS